MCLQNSGKLFVNIFLVTILSLVLISGTQSYASELSETKKSLEICKEVTLELDKDLQSCKKDLSKIDKRDKVLFFFNADNLGYFGIGLMIGIIL